MRDSVGVIVCLGLFGLVAFSAGRRTKEIGIRKVLGATVAQIAALISTDFIKLVGIAITISIPIAHFAVSHWLENFAYHVELSPFVFVGAGLLAMVIAIVTVGYQSITAANADPVESMRYE